jgi:hypothetical protein
VTLLQAWLFIGIPAAALGLGMFIGSSRWRPLLGYLILIVGFVAMAAFHRPSGALFGVLIALLYAAGRGGSGEQVVTPMSATGHSAAEAAEQARTREPTAGFREVAGGEEPGGEEHPTPTG